MSSRIVGMWKRKCSPPDRAFTISELLMVIGVLAILIAIVLPSLSKARAGSREVVSLSNCRQIGIALQLYANQYSGGPPLMFRPVEARYPPDFQTVTVNGVEIRGNWFDLEARYSILLGEFAAQGIFFAPGRPVVPGDRAPIPDYFLSKCLYASPEYWNRWTQAGATQWSPQRYDQVIFPSDKGLVYQSQAYGLPGQPAKQQTQGFDGVSASVLWADGSSTNQVLASLHPGEPNFFDHYRPDQTFLGQGWPIAATLSGIQGRDRGGTYTFPRRQR